MPEYKRHHYVPQFYLRNFSPDTGSVERGLERIALFNLDLKKHVPSTKILEQCQESYFYGQEPTLEKLFGKLEDYISPKVSEIIKTSNPPKKNSSEHFDLVNFLIFQKDRTPSSSNDIKNWAESAKKGYVDIGKKPENLKFLDVLQNDKTQSVLYSLGLDSTNAPVLMDLWMKVLLNKTEIEFITSDSPVVLYNQWCQGVNQVSPTGWASMGLQIFWPISPRHLMLFYDDTIYDASIQPGKSCEIKDVKQIEQINSLQLLSVNKNLYFSGDQKTKDSINNFPFHKHRNLADSNNVTLHKHVSGKAYKMLFNHEMQNMNLDFTFLKIKKSKLKTPMSERKYAARPAAQLVVEDLHGPRPEEFSNKINPNEFHFVKKL